MWGAKFWPPFFLSFPFSFLLSPSSTFLPPLLLFTFFFHLIFLLHPTISSLKNYFPKLLNLPSLISLNIYIYIYFQILLVLAIFLHTHFQNPLFFAQKCHPPPMDLLYLLFMERNIIHHLNGMMRRSSFKTPRLMLHIPTWTSRWVFLCFFFWKNVISMLHWKFDVETLSFYCVHLLEFGALYDWLCCNLGFGAFLNCCIFWSWCNLDNVDGSWILAMLVICDFVEWILAWILGALKLWKICCVGLVE